MIRSFVLISFLFFTSRVFAEWPVELVKPDSVVVQKDNSLSVNQKTDEYLYESTIKYSLEKEFDKILVNQDANYTYENDELQNYHKHFVELPGSFIKKEFPFTFSSIGIEWQPYGYINSNKNNGEVNASLWLGPKVQLKFKRFPIYLNGGGLYHAENSNTTNDPFNAKVKDVEHDGGFYGGIEMGDYSIPLFSKFPLYASGKIEGIYTSQAKITKGNVGSVFIHNLKIPGEFQIFIADTLSKGRKAQIIGGSDISDKTINSLNFLTGLKDIGPLFIKPSILYGLKSYSRHYPDYLDPIPDLEQYTIRENRLLSGIGNNDSSRIDFYSWLDLKLESEDHLDRSTFKAGNIIVNEDVDTFTLSDTLLQNEKDSERRYALLTNRIEYNILKRINLCYSNYLERSKIIYPNIYIYSDGDTTRPDDRDRVSYNHNFNTDVDINSELSLIAQFDYKKSINVHLNREFSASNKTTRKYLIDLILRYEKSTGSYLNTNLGLTSKNEEFPDEVKDFYQAIDISYSKFPTFGREFYLKLNWQVLISKLISIEGFLTEKYYDNGYWDIGTWKEDFTGEKYLISDKNVETSLQVSGNFLPCANHIYKIGFLIQNLYTLNGNNEKTSRVNGYLVDFRPFFEFNVIINKRIVLNGAAEFFNDFKVHGDDKLIDNFGYNFCEMKALMEVMF